LTEKRDEKEMKKIGKKSLVLLLSLTLLLAGNLQIASAANLDALSNYSINLSISPSHIEENPNTSPSGYIHIVNRNGITITTDRDVEVTLTSDNSKIVSVPEKITFPANAEFLKFDLKTNEPGTTTITATLNDKVDFEEITVGSDETRLPDDIVLELNLPTSNMHVNSVMPFSVFLRTFEGEIIRAPYDIEITLDYEKKLATPNTEKLIIEKGNYYAWGTIQTFEKIGNTFLRVTQPEIQLDAVKNIDITSTFPTTLELRIYPELIPAETDRNLEIFVSLLDSDGSPTVAHRDIPLDFFSDEQDYVGDDLDDTMEERKMVIKKGDFGFHFSQDVDLIGLLKNNIIIGVSAPGFGVATDTFSTVGESISVEAKRVSDVGFLSSDRLIRANDDKIIQFFGPDKIPSNSTAYFAYQMTLVEFDEDDPDEVENYINQIEAQFGDDYDPGEEDNRNNDGNIVNTGIDDETDEDDDISEKVQKFDIDYLSDNELYPLQAAEVYQADGLIVLLNVVTSDESIATVTDPGRIKSTYSTGVVQITSTQKSGDILISASLKGVGSSSFETEVVNSLEQKSAYLFSPTGKDTLLFEKDGAFDMFVVALDSSKRPKTLDSNLKYLITPSNSLMEIKKGDTFALATLQSDSFSNENEQEIDLEISPIGEGADLSLSSSQSFESQLSSKLTVMIPATKINIENKQGVGIIQLVDLQGNPVPASKDIKAKISSSDREIAFADNFVIKKGSSFTEFPIDILGTVGSSIISVSAKGLLGDEAEITAASSASSLSIFTSGLVEPIPVNSEIQVKVFVDDEDAESIAGAKIAIMPNENATTSVDLVRTGPDGSAIFGVTALTGPEITIDFTVQAEGYTDGEDSIDIIVDYDPATASLANVNLPPELVYIIIGGIVVVIIIVVLFLKKSKETLDEEEEPWEEYEDI
jgi:hypothetical protein